MKKIALHGVPRSGTTWVGSIFDSSENVSFKNQPLFSYAFKSRLNDSSSKLDIDCFFEDINISDDYFINQLEEKKNKQIPVFKKKQLTHIVYKETRYHNILKNLLKKDNEIKVIGIVRNPKSVISSWYHANKEFNQCEWDLLIEWQSAKKKNLDNEHEFYGYNKWKEVSHMFIDLKERYPTQFYLIEYSKLLRETILVIKDLFDFCEISYSQQTEDFLKQSSSINANIDPYSVFRKTQNDAKWKDTLPREIIDYIDKDLLNTSLAEFNT